MSRWSRRELLTAGLLVALLGGTIATSDVVAAQQERSHGAAHDLGAHSDPIVIHGLIWAALNATGLARHEARDKLRAGQSVEQLAREAGSSANAVLTRFDAFVDRLMARAVETGRLPQTVADARAAWFKQSARLQIDQPGLAPRFPGLHELHVVMISAAVETSGLPRAAVREQFRSCATLAGSVATKGKTGADVAATAMRFINRRLDAAVVANKLTTAQRDEWRAALQGASTQMTSTPGLHVAGKECAP